MTEKTQETAGLNNNILKIFNNSIFWLVIFVLNVFLLCNHVLCLDDTLFNFMYGEKITMNREYYYGSWVMPLQNFLMYYLPYKLGINLQDWAQYAGCFIQSVFFTTVTFFFWRFFKLLQLSLKINYILTVLMYMLLMYLMGLVLFKDILIYSGFFRFTLPAGLLIIWIYYIYKILTGKDVNIFLFGIFSVFVAYSSEIVGFIAAFTSLLLYIYSLIVKEHNKKLLIVFLASILGCFILLCTNGFQSHFNAKLQNHIFDLNIFLSNFLPFTKVYVKKLFIQHGLFFLGFLLLIILNIKHTKAIKEIVLSTSLTISVCVFSFMLLILGKTHYIYEYWVEHKDIYSVFYFIFIVVLILLTGNLIKKYEQSKQFKNILFISIIIISLTFSQAAVHLKSAIQNTKDFTYLRDKMIMYYISENKNIILPFACHTHSIYAIMYYHHVDFEEFLLKYIREDDPQDRDIHSDNFINYYKFTYKTDISTKINSIKLTNGVAATVYFIASGGNYSEIKDKKYSFSDIEKLKKYLPKHKENN